MSIQIDYLRWRRTAKYIFKNSLLWLICLAQDDHIDAILRWFDGERILMHFTYMLGKGDYHCDLDQNGINAFMLPKVHTVLPGFIMSW